MKGIHLFRILVLIFIGISVVLLMTGHELLGVFLLLLTIGAAIALFIIRRQNREEAVRKKTNTPTPKQNENFTASQQQNYNTSVNKSTGSSNTTEEDENDEDVITLTMSDGEEVDFIEIAGIKLESGYYLILQPVELLDGMDEDEALVFKVEKGVDGENTYNIELDDKINDAVFAEYNRLLDEQK